MTGRFKSSTERYRTFGGATYIGWLAYASDDRVVAYRAAGIRCRRLDDDLLIHEDDRDAARAIDHRLDAIAVDRQGGSPHG